MSEKRFIVESVMIDCLCEDEPRIAKVITDTDENYSYEDLYEVVELLNEQQDTISALKDIFKDIITYSEWDSKKPYCSLRIAVDKKTYYKIREILNE